MLCQRLTSYTSQKIPTTNLHTPSVIQIIPNSPLQLRRPLAKHTRQILQIIASGNPEFAHKVLRRRLQIAVVLDAAGAFFVFGTAEVGVGRDGLRAFEALQAGLGFGLGGGVVDAFAEEFV